MLLVFLLNQVIYSKTQELTLQFLQFGTYVDFKEYDNVYLTIEAGEALMMVEWPDATLTINIPSKGVKDLKINKQAGVSFFTFADKAYVNIEFKSNINFFFFPSPYLFTLKGAAIFTTNMKLSELELQHVQEDVYMSFYGLYRIETSLEELSLGKYELRFYKEGSEDQLVSKNFLNGYVDNAKFVTILKNTGSAVINGKVKFASQYPCNPTVPTKVLLKFFEIISEGKNNF